MAINNPFIYRMRKALSPIFVETQPGTYLVDYVDTPKPRVYRELDFLLSTQPEPNYYLDDDLITQITYRIMTNISLYRPKREIEISPVTRMKIHV